MAADKEIRSKLWQQLINKGRFSSATYLLVLAFYLYMIPEPLRLHAGVLVSSALVAFGAILRSVYYHRYITGKNRDQKHLERGITFNTSLVAMGWAALFCTACLISDTATHFPHVTLLVVAGLTGAQAFRLAAVPVLAKTTTLVMLLPASACVSWLLPLEQGLPTIAISLVYYAFLWAQINESNQYLTEAFVNERNSKSEARALNSILDAVPGVVSVLDDQLIYRSINQVGRLFLGFDPLGKKLGIRSENPEFERIVREFFYSNQNQYSCELKMQHQGQSNWFFVSMRKLFVPNPGMIVVSIPIDELKNAQKEIESQKAKADYASRLASLGEMAGGIAHEINNPLSIISAKAQMMERVLERNELQPNTLKTLREHSSGIVQLIDRIAKIIRGLKTFAKDGMQDPPAPTPLSSVVEETVVFCENRFKSANIQLNVDIEPNLWVSARAVQLSQVLLNLLNNAFDACEKVIEPKIQILGRRENSWIQLKVIDNGSGIPPQIREKIMQPFFTTKEVGKGTGLGLSISQGIISNHGGRLFLNPDSMQTEFVIELPILEKRQTDAA